MSEYKMVRLGDVCSFQTGINIDRRLLSTESTEGVPVVLHSDLEEGKVSTYYKGEYSKEQFVHAGEYLVSISDVLSIELWEGEDALFSHHFCRLSPKEDLLNPAYMFYALNYIFDELDNDEGGMSECLEGDITVEALGDTMIPLPDLDNQGAIVAVLDSAYDMFNLQAGIVSSATDLIEARFCELFGFVNENSLNWEVQPLGNLTERLNSRSLLGKDRIPGEYPYYDSTGISDKINDYLFDEDLVLVSKVGSVLVSGDGPIARAVSGKVWPSDLVHVLRIKSGAGILPIYLEAVINNLDISDKLRGGVMPKLSKAALNELLIPMPPVELQVEFKNFIDILSDQIKGTLSSLENIKQIITGLNQKYFEIAIVC